MPRSVASPSVALIFGEDDFGVKQRARQLFDQWSEELGGMDHEIIDAQAANSGEALKALGRLREALQTLPFFGSGKAVWFRDCNFLSDERTASAQAVTAALGDLTAELKTFTWGSVRLLVSAGKVDKRKAFYKTLEKIGTVEPFAALSAEDKDWAEKAEVYAAGRFQALGKRVAPDALARFVSQVGPNLRLIHNEVEKLALYAGARVDLTADDVATVVSRQKHAQAFALGDALGDRDLPRLLRCLDESLWEIKMDKKANEIGLLYGLITKVRSLILVKELIREKWVRPVNDFSSFRTQLSRVPADKMPADKKFNPLSINPYVLFRAARQSERYSMSELIRAMELLLECNQRLIFSTLEADVILQQTLVEIIQPARAFGRSNVTVP